MDNNNSKYSKPSNRPLPRLVMARAVTVALGPSALLHALSVAATVLLARRLVTGPRRPLHPLITLVTIVAAAFPWVYVLVLRPWHRRWGVSDAEQRMTLPGDERVPNPCYEHTRAVTIRAPAAHVWQWLVQIGQNRGGFYSYDWLENLAGCDIHSADRVHPEWQSVRVGDTIAVVRGWGPRVIQVNPHRSLVIEGWGTYAVESVDSTTSRLISRARHPGGWGLLGYTLFVEIPHFIMERRMLLGLRDRAERSTLQTQA